MFNLQVLNDPPKSILEKIGRLRHDVWRYEAKEFGDFELLKTDAIGPDEFDTDHNVFHVLVWHRDRLVGSARLLMRPHITLLPDARFFDAAEIEALPGPSAVFSRLVVDPGFRRLGISKWIDEARMEKARSLGIQSFMACALGEHRAKQFVALGFESVAKMDGYSCPNYRTTRPCFLMLKKHPAEGRLQIASFF